MYNTAAFNTIPYNSLVFRLGALVVTTALTLNQLDTTIYLGSQNNPSTIYL